MFSRLCPVWPDLFVCLESEPPESATNVQVRNHSVRTPTAVPFVSAAAAAGQPTTPARNATPTPSTGGPSPSTRHATTTAAAGAPPSPPRRRRRSSTGSRGRSPRPPVHVAWQVEPPNRPSSLPRRPTEVCSASTSKPSPPASPERFGAADGDLQHHHHYPEVPPPPPHAGGLDQTSPAVVRSPAGFAAAASSSSDTRQQRGRRGDEHLLPVETEGSRTIESRLAAEPEWHSLCQSGYDSCTGSQVRWAMLMIAEVSDGIGAPTEILALAAMTLGAAFGDPMLLETSLRDDDLFLVPAACVLDALCRNPGVFEFNPEAVIDKMVAVAEAVAAAAAAAKGGIGGYGVSGDKAGDAKARLVELRRMVQHATQQDDGCRWAGPMELIIELIRRSGIPVTEEKVRSVRGKVEVFVRSAVLDGALAEFAPSRLACSAFFGATGILMSFGDDEEEAEGSDDDDDGEGSRGWPDDLVEQERDRRA